MRKISSAPAPRRQLRFHGDVPAYPRVKYPPARALRDVPRSGYVRSGSHPSRAAYTRLRNDRGRSKLPRMALTQPQIPRPASQSPMGILTDRYGVCLTIRTCVRCARIRPQYARGALRTLPKPRSARHIGIHPQRSRHSRRIPTLQRLAIQFRSSDDRKVPFSLNSSSSSVIKYTFLHFAKSVSWGLGRVRARGI
jgi:hypothetical protein